MIAGSDFVEDLLALLDIMEPVVELVARVKALQTPMWKLKLWWPKVKDRLEKAAKGDEGAYPSSSGSRPTNATYGSRSTFLRTPYVNQLSQLKAENVHIC